jgi:hypothetical protein
MESSAVCNKFITMIGLLLCATVARADLINLNDATGIKSSVLPEGSLQQNHDLYSFPGATLIAAGDVVSASAGYEFVVAAGTVLTIYASNGATVLGSRDFSPEVINQIAIGECRADLAGLEVGVASQNPSGPTGLVRVLNPDSGSLGDANGSGSGFNVTSIQIADVDNRSGWEGGEVIITWVYSLASLGSTQVAVFHPTASGFSSSSIRNIPGTVPARGLAVGEALGDGGLPEIGVCSNNGEVSLFSAAFHIEGGGDAGLLNYAKLDGGNNPVSLRSGFTNPKAIAMDDISTTNTSGETAVYSTDGGGSLRVLDANLAGLPDLKISTAFSDAIALAVASDGVYVATPAGGGSLIQLDAQLQQVDQLASMGTWVDMKRTPGTTGLVPVALSSFSSE